MYDPFTAGDSSAFPPFAHSGPRCVRRLRGSHQILDHLQHLPEIERLPQVAVRAEAVCLLLGTFQQLRVWPQRVDLLKGARHDVR